MKSYLSSITLLLLISLKSFAQEIPVEAARYIDDADVSEITNLISELSPGDEYGFEIVSNGLKLTIKGGLALEMMGYTKDNWVEPLWGLMSGRYAFDIYQTNAVENVAIAEDFRCVQKRWPQKNDGYSHALFRLRLYAAAVADASRINEIWNSYNICTKIYN